MRRVVWLLPLVMACGSGLIEEGYQGVPAFSFEGLVEHFPLLGEVSNFRASIFWSLTGEPTAAPEAMIEQPDVAVRVTFPATFRMNIYQPPSDPRLRALPQPYRVGMIVAYEDLNQNGRMEPQELAGGALNAVLLHAERPVAQEESPVGGPLPAGYFLARLPLDCQVEPRPLRDIPLSNSCGALLGNACEQNQDCGSRGYCERSVRNGYCQLWETDSCTPENGVLDYPINYVTTSTGPIDPPLSWYLACNTDEDCRVEEGYECVNWLGACFPRIPVAISIGYGPSLELPSLCKPGD